MQLDGNEFFLPPRWGLKCFRVGNPQLKLRAIFVRRSATENLKTGTFPLTPLADESIFRAMNLTESRWLPVALLICSNIFMTVAWYGNLNPKFKHLPLWLIILASWGIAFFEYLFMIPANRIGYSVYSVTQLKIIQEVITLTVFCVFAMIVLHEKIRWNYVAAFVCLLAAVAFAFWPKPQ